MSVPGWNSEVGGGAVTANVACAVCPAPTEANEAGEEAVTVQPDGAGSVSRTSRTGCTPLSVKVSVMVAAWPPVSVAGPVSATVVAGGASCGKLVGLTRNRATPCEGTSAAIVDPLSMTRWVHRLSSR